MAYAESVKKANAVAVNDLIRAYVSADGHGKVFDPTLGGTVAAASANLPKVTSIDAISVDEQLVLPASATNTDTNTGGPVRLHLTVAAADIVEAASVQNPWLEGGAVVVVATG